MSVLWLSLFFLLAGVFLCAAADLKKYDLQNIICSQGLKRCKVIKQNSVVHPPDSGPLEVLGFGVESALCREGTLMYKACLRIRIQLRIHDDVNVSGETPEDSEDDEHAALTLCCSSPPNLPSCKTITFIVKSNVQKNQEVVVVVHDDVFLGSSVTVTVNKTSQVVHIPRQSSVCPAPLIEECKSPNISHEISKHRGVVELKAETNKGLSLCMKRKGMAMCWSSNWTIPLHAITHCMCFQAWSENTEDEKSWSSRSQICPFENNEEIRRNAVKNLSLSVGRIKTNEGAAALSWNLSAPCRLETEVWPCQMAVSVGGDCSEVPGFRQIISTGWEENISMVWTSGVFQDVQATNNLPVCVMFKVDGEMFGPLCERDAYRGRWVSLGFVMLLVFVLLAFGVFVLRSRFKEWLSNSNPRDLSRGLRGEVLLVHSSGSDLSLLDTVCWFATWLSELGFSVSLDLWNQVAVSAIGPTPWLHSRLQHVQKHGGKTLLLLSHDAVLRTKACYETWSSVLDRDDGRVSSTSWPWNSDVFSSALSALFSARLQGGATEHFAVVQLESEALDMPELFQGLRLYQLPSGCRRLLSDLHTKHPENIGAQLKRFFWTWRASTRLERRLRNCEKEQRSRTESTLTQVDALSMEMEMEEETRPLNI
ncbi:uncharacterized protein il17rc isoform X2 [Neoarius graeffei]|uniref:uncharacterized protein il17rc isoform X2 n=1 Tax=Neoarius graeffei TaxID=443677 RepID=UPI00298CC10A|nr:uncharacterized protein il17rc isoform X2 [Neoarius graeffei]